LKVRFFYICFHQELIYSFFYKECQRYQSSDRFLTV
jgi:hypothetical protein